jgi:DNA mismatch repair protein MutS
VTGASPDTANPAVMGSDAPIPTEPASESASERQPDALATEATKFYNTCTPSQVVMQIDGLRHPILEEIIGASSYISSNIKIAENQRMCIITGPNMGGKSTFMRALGLCVILAHMGSFVPAKKAVVPIVDKVFMRFGATDYGDAGISTFMSEMLDVANILDNASDRSLVLIDELGAFCSSLCFSMAILCSTFLIYIVCHVCYVYFLSWCVIIGRGTSVDDGFGIASAVLHTLKHRNRSIVCCATHFYELTTFLREKHGSEMTTETIELTSEKQHGQVALLPSMRSCADILNLHAGAHVSESSQDGTKVTMLFEILPGAANRSYGIHVAQVAQFPASIVQEAREIEDQLLNS